MNLLFLIYLIGFGATCTLGTWCIYQNLGDATPWTVLALGLLWPFVWIAFLISPAMEALRKWTQ